MVFSFLPYSIVNDSSNPKDYDSPYSFLAFIQYQNFSNIDVNEQLKSYQQYVNTWASKKNFKKSEETAVVRDAYVNLMREITLNFSTEEEKRFILNADFNDDSDLDIIIPFFIQKIKQISLYYRDKRKDVKNSLIKYNLKGSNLGIETIVKKLVYEYVNNNLRTNKKELSSFQSNFDVSISETYSDSDGYYDKSENGENTFTNKIDPNVFINIKQSIVDAISAYPFYLKNSDTSYISNFTYNPILSGTELQYLKSRDFIDYIQNGQDSLKLNLFKSLYPKFIGTNFYYLSTNSQNQSVSGLLFDSDSFDGQYLNKHFPTTALTQSLDNIYTAYELGGFFIPQNQGFLIYNTPKKTYEIDLSKLDGDKVYLFPDPNKIGNTIYTSDQENENVPLIYLIDVQWNKTKISNGYKFNDVLSNNYNQLFYGYQSRQQNTKVSTEGIAKVTDNVTFWKGDKNAIWDGSFDVNSYPIDADKENLLLNEGVAVDWYCDESSNEFGLYKKLGSYSKYSNIPSLSDGGLIEGSNTSFEERNIEEVSLYEKKNVTHGKIFVRNNYYNKSNNIVDALSSIFFKYPVDLRNEVESKSIKFFIVNNIFIIETENYVVSDAYSYDIEKNVFKNVNTKPFYKQKGEITKYLDVFINSWYDEKYKRVFLAFLTTENNSLSSSNYKSVVPEIYSTDLKKIDYKKIYPLPNTDTTIYSLSSSSEESPEINLTEYVGGSFKKNPILNEFDLTYMAKNSNSLPFIVNEKLYYQSENNTFSSRNPILLKPFYYILDNNFANPEMPYYVRGISNKSGYIGEKDSEKLNVIENLEEFRLNYLFADTLEDLKIEKTGKYIIQFDWESYNNVNFFIGCSSVNVKNIGDNLLLNFGTKFEYLSSFEETYNILNFNVAGDNFKIEAKHPNKEILTLNVSVSGNPLELKNFSCV